MTQLKRVNKPGNAQKANDFALRSRLLPCFFAATILLSLSAIVLEQQAADIIKFDRCD